MGKLVFALAFVAGCSSTTNYFVTETVDAAAMGPDNATDATLDGDTSTVDANAAPPVDGDANAPGAVDASDDAEADAGDDSDVEDKDASVDVDASTTPPSVCDGFVRYEIPKGNYAWAKKCSGFVLSATVHDPPTQDECKYVGSTMKDECTRWVANTDIVVHFRPASGTECDINIFPLPVEPAHSCNE